MLVLYGKRYTQASFADTIDVTQKIIANFINGNQIIIKGIQYNQIFTDPCYGVLKNLYIFNNDKEYSYEENSDFVHRVEITQEDLKPDNLKKYKAEVMNSNLQKVKFNVYTLNWNESRLLPAFLHYYREANRVIVYDNESTDNSVELIKEAGREVRTYKSNNTINDQIYLDLKNNIWKESTDVDFVIVQDLDEFVYFPDYPDNIKGGLIEYKKLGITAAVTEGYNMFCTDEEWDNALIEVKKGINISYIIREGIRSTFYDKGLLFDPNIMKATNYGLGCHSWNPVGNLKFPEKSPYCLHYKHIGFNYVAERIEQQGKRLSDLNKRNGWAIEYMSKDNRERLKKEFDKPKLEVTKKQ